MENIDQEDIELTCQNLAIPNRSDIQQAISDAYIVMLRHISKRMQFDFNDVRSHLEDSSFYDSAGQTSQKTTMRDVATALLKPLQLAAPVHISEQLQLWEKVPRSLYQWMRSTLWRERSSVVAKEVTDALILSHLWKIACLLCCGLSLE